MRMIDILENMI